MAEEAELDAAAVPFRPTLSGRPGGPDKKFFSPPYRIDGRKMAFVQVGRHLCALLL